MTAATGCRRPDIGHRCSDITGARPAGPAPPRHPPVHFSSSPAHLIGGSSPLPSSSAVSTGGAGAQFRHPRFRPAGPAPNFVIRRLDRRIQQEAEQTPAPGMSSPPDGFAASAANDEEGERHPPVHHPRVIRRLDRRIQQTAEPISGVGAAPPPAGFAGQAGERRIGEGVIPRGTPPIVTRRLNRRSLSLPSSSAVSTGGAGPYFVIRRLDGRIQQATWQPQSSGVAAPCGWIRRFRGE
ncbi:MAG: hypothetical protein KatS3mg119_1909 [Rhodothalassiaceae bacterium]|nr:MAG: hypothetical protein KatS3mg119_1909 [Rhodothalassiaceae bacterium]